MVVLVVIVASVAGLAGKEEIAELTGVEFTGSGIVVAWSQTVY